MLIFWGVILIIFTLIICWIGQIITSLKSELAVKMQLADSESDVDPAFYADGRGEAIWDSFSLWTLPVTGILMILNNDI